MEELAPIAFVLVFAAVVGLLGWLVVRTFRHNRAPRDPAVSRHLADLAARRGWRYTSQDNAFIRRFSGYPFGRGRNRPVFDLITGTHRGRAFACFQYSPPRSLPPGEQPAEIDYIRVVAVSLPAPVPTVMVMKAGSSPRWSRRYTVGDDTFDLAFAVGTVDNWFADQVLVPPVRQWLMSNPPLESLRFGSADLISWQADDGGFDADRVVPAVDWLCDLVDRIPPDVLLRRTP